MEGEPEMAKRVISRLYDNYDDAAHLVEALETAGVLHSDISLVASNADSRRSTDTGRVADHTAAAAGSATDPDVPNHDAAPASAGTRDAVSSPGYPPPGTAADPTQRDAAAVRDGDDDASDAGTGATVGTVLGGGAGLLAGIGALAIPGAGPVVAAGWLVATLTGAGVGAATGGLIGSLTGAGLSDADANVYAEGVRRGGTLVIVRADDDAAPRIEAIRDSRKSANIAARRSDYESAGWSRFDPAGPVYGLDRAENDDASPLRL